MKKIHPVVSVILGVFILAACQSVAPQTRETSASLTGVPLQTSTPSPPGTPTQTPLPTATLPPTETPLPSRTPTATPPTFVRENTSIPLPSEPITTENAEQMVELARLGKGRIVDVQLSPDRNYLIVQTTIGIYGYLADSQVEVWRFEDPAGIADMALTRTERWMALATNDGRIALLIYSRGSMFTRWETGYQQIIDLAFSYDGHTLAAVGDQGVMIWPLGATEPVHHYPDLIGEMVRFTPDGEGITIWRDSQLGFYALPDGSQFNTLEVRGNITYSVDDNLFTDGSSIWNAPEGEKLVDLDSPENGVTTGVAAFSQNSEYLAVGVNREGYAYIGLWQTSTGNFLTFLISPFSSASQPSTSKNLAAPVSLSGSDPQFSDLAFDPEGRMLAASHESGYIELWDLQTNDYRYQYSELGGHLIFRKASRLALWNELEVRQIEPRQGILIHSTTDFVAGRRLTYSQDGRWLFADWVVWDMDGFRRTLRLGDEIVAAVSLAGDAVFSFDRDDHVFVHRRMSDFGVVDRIDLPWDYSEGLDEIFDRPWMFSPFQKFSISPTGDFISVNVSDHGVQTWNLVENKIEDRLSGFSYSDSFYSPDGKFLILVIGDGFELFQLFPEIAFIQEYLSFVICGFSPNGERLLAAQGDRWVLFSFQENGELTEELSLSKGFGEWNCGAFSQNESLLAVNSILEFSIVDPETGQEIAQLPAHLDEIASMAFSPDGRYLATSSYDGTVKLWGIP